MGVSSRVDYILTQHLSSAKEAKLLKDFEEVRDLDTNGTKKPGEKIGMKTITANNSGGATTRSMPKCVHPHFVLDCCEAGRIVPVEKYLTTPKCSVFSSSSSSLSSANTKQKKKEVIELD